MGVFEAFVTLFVHGGHLLYRFVRGDRNGERIGCVTIFGAVVACMLLCGVIALGFDAPILGGIVMLIFLNMAIGAAYHCEKEISDLNGLTQWQREDMHEKSKMPEPTSEEIISFQRLVFNRVPYCVCDTDAVRQLKAYRKSWKLDSYAAVTQRFLKEGKYPVQTVVWPTDTMKLIIHDKDE